MADSAHYVFPARIHNRLDPTQPAKSWHTSWRAIRKQAAYDDESKELLYPNLKDFRFHNTRHCAVTVLAEAGVADATIMAQVGHLTREMVRHYSHIRRQALNDTASTLEPGFLKAPVPAKTPASEVVN